MKTDKELRRFISSNPFNGPYAMQICRNCEAYLQADDGDTNTCKIVDRCGDCFDPSKNYLDAEQKKLLVEALRQYERQQIDLLTSLVGSLYSSMVIDKIEATRNLLIQMGEKP